MNKIIIQIFGNKDENINSGCGMSEGCSGCGSNAHKCSGCGNHGCGNKGETTESNKTMDVIYSELVKFIMNSDVGDKVSMEFVDINKVGIHPYYDIEDLVERGFDPPITVIDGIVRYYGGISGKLIYNDVKELLS